MERKKAVLLVNLGTPESPTRKAVGRYLREFLMDEYVIDLPVWARFFLVNGIIVPFRSGNSAKAYRSIWQEDGSPLQIYTNRLSKKLRQELSDGLVIQYAMRYGMPSIASRMEEFRQEGIEDVLVIPLYPQYALSSTETCKQACLRAGRGLNLQFQGDFYADERFFTAWQSVYIDSVRENRFDHYLFSFHGIPVHHLTKISNLSHVCSPNSNSQCCETITGKNANCYRAQCVMTARGIAHKLNLSQGEYSISFQSRLGRRPWIQPYTDIILDKLVKKGVKRLAVLCPAFVADCLETIEEIGIRAREDFLSKGGEDLVLVPSLNDHPKWVMAVSGFIRDSFFLHNRQL